MTAALEPLLHSLALPGVTYTFFTAPAPSPRSIDDEADARLSADISLPHLLPLLSAHHGFVVACYSEHPLVPLLRAATARPVVGIFEASMTQALLLLRRGERFGIVTTGKVWEGLLGAGARAFLGGGERLAGVESSGLTAVELHEVGKEEVERRVGEAAGRLVVGGGVRVVCLGCAGMAGMAEVVRAAAKRVGVDGVEVVDGVRAAAAQVVGLVRCVGGNEG